AQPLRIGIAIQADSKTVRARLPRELEVVEGLGSHSQATGKIVVRDLSVNDEQLVFLQTQAVLFIEFVEHRDLDLCRAIVQQGIQHLPATRHARPDSRQYTGEPLQAARGLQPRK